MSKKGSSKSKIRTQKVVVPKGTIDPSDTTVIEIPSNLYGQPLVIAKRKESLRRVRSSTVTLSDEGKVEDDEDIPVISKRSLRNRKEREDIPCPNRSCTSMFPPNIPGSSSSYISPEVLNLEETENNERLLILSQLENYQKARRKFLIDASTLATKSNTSTNSHPTSNYVPQILARGGYSPMQPNINYTAGGKCQMTTTELSPGIINNNTPQFNSTIRDNTPEKPMHYAFIEPTTSNVKNRYLVSSGTNTYEQSPARLEWDQTFCSGSKSVAVQKDIIVEAALRKEVKLKDTKLKSCSNTSNENPILHIGIFNNPNTSTLDCRPFREFNNRRNRFDDACNSVNKIKPFGPTCIANSNNNSEDDCTKCYSKPLRPQIARDLYEDKTSFKQKELDDLKQQIQETRRRLDETLAMTIRSQSSCQLICPGLKNVNTNYERSTLHDTASCPVRKFTTDDMLSDNPNIEMQCREHVLYQSEPKYTKSTKPVCRSEQLLKKKAGELKDTLQRISVEKPPIPDVDFSNCLKWKDKYSKDNVDESTTSKLKQNGMKSSDSQKPSSCKYYQSLLASSDKQIHSSCKNYQNLSTKKQLDLKPSLKIPKQTDHSSNVPRKTTCTQTVETSIFIIKGPKRISSLDENDSFTSIMYQTADRCLDN